MQRDLDERNFSRSANSTLRRNLLLPLCLLSTIDQAFRSSSFVGESNFSAGNTRTAHSASAHNKSSDASFLVQGNNGFEIQRKPSRLFPSREGSRQPEENLKMSLERPPSQPGTHTAFKSTLANLSAGLATLDEGEYLQWGGNKSNMSSNNIKNAHKKAVLKSRERSSIMRNTSQNNSTTIEANTIDESVLLKKSIDYSSPLEKRVKVNRVKDLLEMSKIDNKNNENMFKELFDDVGVGAVKPVKARSGSLRGDIGNWRHIKSIQNHLGMDGSSDLMVISDRISGILGSCNRSDLEIGAQTPEVDGTIRQSFSGSLRRSGKFRPWRADTAEKNERGKTSVVKIVTPNETKESRKGDIVLPKFNIGGYLAGESIATKASHQGDGLSLGYSAVDLKNAEPGWAFSGQWRTKKTLYSFRPKENSRRILRERSLEKTREGSPQKTKKEGEKSFSNYEKILKEMESAEELKNRGGHIGRVVWDESDLYKVQKTETVEMAERFLLDQNKIGVFPTLTPKLPAKRDFIGVRKHLLPFRTKDRVFDEILKDSERTGILDEFGKSLRDTEPRKDGIDQQTSRKKRMNVIVVNEDQARTKAQAMLEERMRLLEEKYTRGQDDKETITPREEPQEFVRENHHKATIEENDHNSSRKKRIPGPGLSVDSKEVKKKLRGLRNILKLIK